MEYKLSEQELKDLMHQSWLKAKKFYSGKTDDYFYDYFESEKKKLTLTDVVSQLVCPNNEQHIVKKEYANKYCMVCGVLK